MADREKIKIGKMSAWAEAIHGSDYHLHWLRHAPRAVHHYYRVVYLWDCAKEPGGNPPLPDHVDIGPALVPFGITPGGTVTANRAKLDRLHDAIGVPRGDTGAVDDAVAAAFPPDRVDLKAVLAKVPFDDTVKIEVAAYVTMSWFLLTRIGPGKRDRYLLGLPFGVEFYYFITVYCGLEPFIGPQERVDLREVVFLFGGSEAEDRLQGLNFGRLVELQRMQVKGIDWVWRQMAKWPPLRESDWKK